jgi:HEAT repeat protein
MTNSEFRKNRNVRATNWICLLLLTVLLLGCGPRIPDDFTVSGRTLDDWLEAQSDSQPEVRARAVRALSNVGPVVPEVVPALIRALKDPDASVRSQAALALLKFGPEAKEAIPALTDAQSDSDETVRDLAAKALEKIQPN